MSNYFYKNLYEILELEPTDDVAKIKSAYRKLARKYHPDLNGGNLVYEEKFKEISQACEILMDKDKKVLYDTFKGYKFSAQKVSPDAQKAKQAYERAKNTGSKNSYEYSNNVANSTKGFSDVLNDILEGLFNEKKTVRYTNTAQKSAQNTSKSQPKKKPINGSDINSEIEISINEALNGATRTINILHTDICPNCEGRMFKNGSKCPLCQGSGETSIHKKISVKIPKNVKNNAKIRIAGEGNRGRYGGKNGDVYLVVKVKNDSKYTYDGLNVEFPVTIYPHEAVFGAEIRVQTPQGHVSMKIPANTAQGQRFRLSAHGLKGDNGKLGDAIVVAKIDLPKELTDKELELYKELAQVSKMRLKEERE